jgi:hypothetical protein
MENSIFISNQKMYELLKDLFVARFVYLLSSKNIGFDKNH